MNTAFHSSPFLI
ncbi:hypothetical protein IEO21_08943 [Rhodonia placenta]|nr:hypothetical protein IEO21_08943 [Postia placenta]